MEPLLLAGRSGLPGQAGEGYRLQVIPHCHVSKVLYKNVPGAVRGADGTAHACSRRAVGVEATVKVFPDNFPDMSVKDRLEYICRGTEIKRSANARIPASFWLTGMHDSMLQKPSPCCVLLWYNFVCLFL
jgi:hypothetical protein